MDTSIINQELMRTAMAILSLALPTMIVAAVVGISISIFQAVTQIQDQTLPQITRIIAVTLFLMAFLAILSAPLVRQTRRLFEDIPILTG